MIISRRRACTSSTRQWRYATDGLQPLPPCTRGAPTLAAMHQRGSNPCHHAPAGLQLSPFTMLLTASSPSPCTSRVSHRARMLSPRALASHWRISLAQAAAGRASMGKGAHGRLLPIPADEAIGEAALATRLIAAVVLEQELKQLEWAKEELLKCIGVLAEGYTSHAGLQRLHSAVLSPPSLACALPPSACNVSTHSAVLLSPSPPPTHRPFDATCLPLPPHRPFDATCLPLPPHRP